MDIYSKKSKWKLWLVVVAAVIVSASLWYANILAGKLADEERKKVELWANAYKQLNIAHTNADITFLLEVIRNNKTVPVILTDEQGKVIGARNLDSLKSEKPEYMQKMLEEMKAEKDPIKIPFFEEQYSLIYYKDSYLLTQLKYFPLVQFGIIGVFLLVSYLAFSSARKAEQNQVWVGMAKETAHQIGTPLSSLLAWVEYLRETTKDDPKSAQIVEEMSSDVARFELIAERFSKIGSIPDLTRHDLVQNLQHTVDYVKRRASSKVTFSIDAQGKADVPARINPQLFDWVVENLLKNALDAMGGKGEINITLAESSNKVFVDITDTGKGIPKSKQKTVFQPGFSTKKRGWGLGLSLSKRIIESYHSGKIFVKESGIGKGATFRITLPKA